MKFGQQLRAAIHPEWRFYYIDYDTLKRTLKQTRLEHAPSSSTVVNVSNDASADSAFLQLLEKELEKVDSFQGIKFGEIERRVQFCKDRVARSNDNLATMDPDELELEYSDIEAEINRVIAEVNELQRFARLNYTGFLKIMKKHDKHSKSHLQPAFIVRLNDRPFYKQDFDKLVYKLSQLYDSVRTRGQPPAAPTGNASGAQNFVRRTTKYWVHPDNVFELKCFILKYLPVLVFNASRDGDSDKDVDPAISSIYFDNANLELYQGRLEKTEGAEAIRFRWYGSWDNPEIFIERKTHREDWTGEASVKQRFAIKEKYVNKFMNGTWTVDKMVRKLREEGKKSEEEVQALEKLANDIQQSILKKKLQPVVRSFYNRTAFQLPGDARVRISLDTQLCMIREDDFDGLPRAGSNWRRVDARTDYPFAHLKDSEIVRFPYAVLEVKLQTRQGTEEPQWVRDLVNSHLVEEVPKFSKFIHGCSVLMEERVPLLPFWLPQMDKDIRKSSSINPRDSLLIRDLPVSAFAYRPPASSSRASRTSSTRDADVRLTVREDRGKQPMEPSTSHSEQTPLLRKRRDSDASSQRSTSSRNRDYTFLGSLGGLFKRRTRRASPSKRVAVPVRVEPKVFFANERTFLSWIHFAIVLGGLALGLLNFGDKTAVIAGVVFTLIAMGIMVYALWLFRWRADRIRRKDPGPYDDQNGPVVLVVVILVAVAINFYLKFSSVAK